MAAVCGLACVLAFALTAGSSAQDYKTSKTCKMCHGVMHKAIVDSFFKVPHAKAFADAAKNPAAIVAVFDDASPVKKEQIKYVLGMGDHGQAYIGADIKTLPAQWDVKAKKWESMPSADARTQCVGCHVVGYDPAKFTWAEECVTCEACHGPGSAHAAGDKTKIVNPKKLEPQRAAMICGQCHSKGTDTSKAYPFPVGFRPGGDLTKSFIDANPTAPGRNQQYSELKQSKHYAKNVLCFTCHEPHGVGTTQPRQLRKPIIELCLGCHADKDMKTHAPSAPAGATCATCHMPGGVHTFKEPDA